MKININAVYDNIVYKLLPCTVITAAFVQLVLQAVCYDFFEDNIHALVIAYIGLFSIIDALIGVKFIQVFISHRDRRKFIIICGVIALLFLLPLLCGLGSYNSWATVSYVNEKEMLSLILQYVVFKLPIYLMLMIVLVEKRIYYFLKQFIYYGILMIPFCLFYLIRMTFCDSDYLGQFLSFGRVNYMAIAFICMIIAMAMSVYYCHCYEEIRFKKAYVVMTILLFVTTMYTGTRSALVCTILFIIILCAHEIFFSDKAASGRRKIPEIGIIIIVLLAAFIFAPANSGVKIRMNSLVHDNEKTVELSSQQMSYVVDREQPVYTSLSELYEEEKATDENSESAMYLESLVGPEGQIAFSRTVLWKLALKEFKKSPVIGNGVMYFQNKYDGIYPHCAFFELLADTGIIGTFLFFALMAYILIRCIMISGKERSLMAIIVLSVSLIPMYLLSSGLYTNENLVFTLLSLIFIWVNDIIDKQKNREALYTNA